MQNLKKPCVIIACVLILAGLLAGLFMAYRRANIEAQTHQSEIVMDWAQISECARKDGVSAEEILSRFAPYITGVLIKEPSVFSLTDEGRAIILGGDEMRLHMLGGGLKLEDVQGNYRYIIFYNEEDALRVLASVNSRLNLPYAELFYVDDIFVLATSLSKTDLTGIGIGFERSVLDMLAKYSLGVAVQVASFDNFTPDAIFSSVKILKDYRVIGVGFNDKTVPGADKDAETWSMCKQAWKEAIEYVNAPLLSVEFYAQDGMEGLSLAMAPNVVRMHSMNETEMKNKAKIEEAPQRYQLATSERNIKVAFVRIPVLEDTDYAVEFVKGVKQAIEAKSTTVGAVRIADRLSVTLPVMLLLIAAVCAGGYLLGLKFKLGKWALLAAALAFLGGAGLLIIGKTALVQKLYALCAALIFPTLSIITLLPEKGMPLGKAVLRIICTCLFSLIGAVLIVGLLADNIYMLKINGFIGVKVAHMIPVVIVLFYYFFLRDEKQKPVAKLYRCINYKVSLGFCAVALAAYFVLMIYVSRTGNEAVAVSGVEKWMRLFLDQTLYVRPRTKEFLLGYPCLLFMYRYGYKDYFLPLLAVGVIGQVSLVNTYAHIHTPLAYSLLRSLNGFWLGILIAITLVLLAGIIIHFGEKNRQLLKQKME